MFTSIFTASVLCSEKKALFCLYRLITHIWPVFQSLIGNDTIELYHASFISYCERLRKLFLSHKDNKDFTT